VSVECSQIGFFPLARGRAIGSKLTTITSLLVVMQKHSGLIAGKNPLHHVLAVMSRIFPAILFILPQIAFHLKSAACADAARRAQ
jgi:hypothetical protein